MLFWLFSPGILWVKYNELHAVTGMEMIYFDDLNLFIYSKNIN